MQLSKLGVKESVIKKNCIGKFFWLTSCGFGLKKKSFNLKIFTWSISGLIPTSERY